MENKNLISNDKPVRLEENDLLSYYPFAEKVQKIIQEYSSEENPLTIGIYGKWGSGKTTFLNFIENQIEIFQKNETDKPYIKLHYNPWLYQNKEEMLFDFFKILSNKLSSKTKNENLQKAGKFIKKYSNYLKGIKLSANVDIPTLAGAKITINPEETFKSIAEGLEGEKPSLEDLKEIINTQLKESGKKIVIFIDDIDRLDKDEIFTLFKLIKVSANFNNLIFITCLDPEYVAKAIHHRFGTNIEDGQLFLEKIINIPLELPLIEEADLDKFIKEKLNKIFNSQQINPEGKKELLSSLDGSYFDNPREVIRICNSFAISLYAIGDEVNLHDLFWIEYLKVKYNKVYKRIKNYPKENSIFSPRSKEYITFNKPTLESNKESGLRKELKEMNDKAYSIIQFLFKMNNKYSNSPSLEFLDSNLKIQHINHFKKYFSYHTKGKISELIFASFKENINNNEDEKALGNFKEIKGNVEEHKVIYRLKSEIKNTSIDFKNKLILFTINHIDLFEKQIEYSPLIELVEFIAENLEEKTNEDKKRHLDIARKLDIHLLSGFLNTLYFKNNTTNLDEIEKILIEKVKEYQAPPVFTPRYTSYIIYKAWANYNSEEFQKYILRHLNSEDNIFNFLKSFTYLWNEKINGIISQDNYNTISNDLKLNTKLIYIKIKEIFPNINDNIESLQMDDHSNNTGYQNAQQFVYWYKKDTNTLSQE